MKDIMGMTALELGKFIRNKDIKAVDAVAVIFDNIMAREPDINAYITVAEEKAYEQAEEVQKKIDSGELLHSPLAGVPAAVKDNICTKGMRTTCASRMLSDFIPVYDATAVTRLKNAGAVIIGKTNMDEFAMGSTTETSFFGAAKNPLDLSRVPGGSSGGSAAAAAAGEAFYSLGSDTGGSIRLPAAYCGVTGIKPTYGTVSRYGLIAYASSFDQIGVIGKDISDCAAVLEVISGYDPRDSTSADRERYSFTEALKSDIRGMRIGIPSGYMGEGLGEDIRSRIMEAADIYKELGASVEEFELEYSDYAVPAYYVIACAQASSNLSRYDGVKYGYRTKDYDNLQDLYKRSRSDGFGAEVRRRIMLGAFVLSSGYYDAYYNKALKVRTLVIEGFNKAFEKYDLILAPTSARTAPKLGECLDDPLKMYLMDMYTVSANMAGLPAASIPFGRDRNSLPVGIQLISRHFGEGDIIGAAFSLEQAAAGIWRSEGGVDKS